MAANDSLALLRPGIAQGDYPERVPDQGSTLDRVADRVAGIVRPLHDNLRPAALRRFAVSVDSAGKALGANTGIAAAAAELRRQFRRQGATDALLARSFALVRNTAGQTLGMRHYDCQVIAGKVMMAGGLAEMATGEGKTLAATLPACTAAMAGIPVHVVTANDYLVQRDAAAMAPVYRSLGFSVGAVTEASTTDMRREAYARDVTYVTSKQLAFDYLRDRLTRGRRNGVIHMRLRRLCGDAHSQLLMRGLCFGIIDEADSVLIDEARTPFVIARERQTDVIEARCREALAAGSALSAGDFHIDRRRRRVELSDSGIGKIEKVGFSGGSRRMREALVTQALAALYVYECDRDYIVREQTVQIIDPNSGRVMADRSWERGLHQMIECKESCPVTAPRETLARLTYQRFFRRYLRLAGMTGTAHEVRDEMWMTYGLPTVRIPTHRPCRRREYATAFTRDRQSKWAAIVAMTRREHDTGRPVLIGTLSVADSEELSTRLSQAGLTHEVLNARQDADEAGIVARAGQRGQITVATNMAGRGTDIALGPGVADLGGLHVIAAGKNDARRLDRQLTGRCARQGEPGSCVTVVAPDDDIIIRHGSRLAAAVNCVGGFSRRLADLMLSALLASAQKRCERYHRLQRRNLSIIQDQMDRLLALSGPRE